ncbi:unnamed protein product [Brassica oleracea var. botrytis]|uniref:(rape) hypothetical protein n=1 Tax=Brassica napus TaxID=3708 RepID=A0A816J5A6_BRANA|nr:unnamed protein product [Brassica napus]
MLLLIGTPPRLTRSVSRRGEELLKAQRSSFSSVSAFSMPSSLPPVRIRLSNVSDPAFVSVTKSPPSLSCKPEPPDLVPEEQLEHLFEALSSPDPPLEALSPPDCRLKLSLRQKHQTLLTYRRCMQSFYCFVQFYLCGTQVIICSVVAA